MDNLDEDRGREEASAADVEVCPVAEGDIVASSVTPAAPKATTPAEAMANLTGLHDVYGYVGDINRLGYEELTRLCAEVKEKKASALLVLATYGGDPDAGFRIARCLRHNYQRLTVIVPGFCKSAGTLICVGADDLVICDKGELGPLDIQINKPDEVDEFSSGLDINAVAEHAERPCAKLLSGSHACDPVQEQRVHKGGNRDCCKACDRCVFPDLWTD